MAKTTTDKTDTKDRPLRGRGGTSNFGNNKAWVKTEVQREIAQQLLQQTLNAYSKQKVKDEQELIQRLDEYFNHCVNGGTIPTVEEMALFCGYSVSGFWELERGNSMRLGPRASEIIKKAKSFLQAFDAKLVICDQISFLAYCFRDKNYYGMVDKREVEVASNRDPLGERMSLEELEARINALPDD